MLRPRLILAQGKVIMVIKEKRQCRHRLKTALPGVQQLFIMFVLNLVHVGIDGSHGGDVHHIAH